MKRIWFFSINFSLLVLLCTIAPTVSAQFTIPPEVELDCDDDLEPIEVSPGSSKITIANCIVSNPTTGDEEVELDYQSEDLIVSGPSSITVSASSEESFEVTLTAESGAKIGEYEVNMTATVTQWSGIPVGFLGSSDEDQMIATVLPFTVCNLNGAGNIIVDSGQDVVLDVNYGCDSNEESVLEVSLHLLEKGSTQERMWPSGFNDMSTESCSVQNPMGTANCLFLLTTPPNLQEKWEGCLIVVDEQTDPGWSCSSDFAVSLTVNEEEVLIPSVGIEINGTILEELGVTEENQSYYIAGGAILLVLVVLLVMVVRRRR